jgi:hypothetical protein
MKKNRHKRRNVVHRISCLNTKFKFEANLYDRTFLVPLAYNARDFALRDQVLMQKFALEHDHSISKVEVLKTI